MNTEIIRIKITERINKLSSRDYDNIECWQVIEAFNKAQVNWCRRQLVGTNILKQGDEQSNRRVDDLQPLLKTAPLTLLSTQLFDESSVLPADYMEYKRLEIYATSDCCKDPLLMTTYLVEEANVVNFLRDDNKKPSFDWGETFITLVGNKVRIYTAGEFQVTSANLMYYKQPIKIQITGCTDPYTGLISTTTVIPDLKDDVVEVLIDDAAAILAGDIESMTQYQREQQAAERNN